MRWAFDADVLVYAAMPAHPFSRAIRGVLYELVQREGYGSVILITELLTKPTRQRHESELATLRLLLGYIELIDLDADLATKAVDLGAGYGLKLADAVHLATAIEARADRFLTNNKRDFKPWMVSELEVVFPETL
ncbi:MAG TPA: PIN domain-containing protein [Dehalococcoidia bacterium]|nr:PIN domain-containing protein [Dehalococcoidia bacterium]